MLFRNPVIRAGGKFQAAAQRIAVQNRDHRLTKPGNRVKRHVPLAHPMTTKRLRFHPAPGPDVATGAEGLSISRQDDDMNPVIMLDFAAAIGQFGDH